MRDDIVLEDEVSGLDLRGQRAGLMARGLAWLSDLVFPPVCLVCRVALVEHDAVCPRCWGQIDFIRPPLCDRLGLPMPYDTGGTMISAAAAADPPNYDRARAVAHFSGVMRELVHDFKFSDQHAARQLLVRLMAEAGRELLDGADLIVPVPLSRRRLLTRRFNQAALLAQELAGRVNLSYEPLVLVRTRATPPQVGLSRGERRRNVRGAFAVPAGKAQQVAGRRIVLIDDVITTGATCGAAARALKRAGAAQVDVLALALVTDLGAVPA